MSEIHFTDKTGRTLTVTDVAPRHLDGIEAIEKACFSMPWTREQLARQMTGERNVFLCAEDETGPLGYVGLMTVLDEGYISNVAVAPEARRRGIADALLTELAARTCETLSFLTLEVRESNVPAIALYEKHGFSVVGQRRSYYEKPQEDALLMTLFFEKEENQC